MLDTTIKIGQEGIGRIVRRDSPEEYIGLYTEGLQTCIAFAMVSAKGISLAHATRILDPEALLAEVEWHERILYSTIIYNPSFYPDTAAGRESLTEILSCYTSFLQDERITSTLRTYDKEINRHLLASPDGKVLVTRKGQIKEAPEAMEFLEVPNEALRVLINEVNSFFMRARERKKPDFQFDGFTYTDLPGLNRTFDDILALMRQEHERFDSFPFTDRLIDKYHEAARALKLLTTRSIICETPEQIEAAAAACVQYALFGTLSRPRPGSGADREADDRALTAATSKDVSGSDLTRP